MAYKMNSQRSSLREVNREILGCGELTPPRSDTSEPSLSPAPAPLSPPSPVPPQIKEEPNINIHEPMTPKNNGMSDHTRVSLCAFLFLFLAFNPLDIIVNNMSRLNNDYSTITFEGRSILNYQGNFYFFFLFFIHC